MIVLVGLLAAALTTGAWLPQLWRTWRTRSARDLSWAYLATTGLGFVTWLTYGLLTREPVIISANITTLVLLGLLVSLKARPVEPETELEPVLEPAA